MKAALRLFLFPFFLVPLLFLPLTATIAKAQAQSPRPWQQITPASTAEVAANFKVSPARVWGDATVPKLERH